MTRSIIITIAVLFSGVTTLQSQASNTYKSDAILGEWINGEKDAKFQIYKTGNLYFGKIIWGEGRDTKDSKNPDTSLRNRELVGLTILENFVYKGNEKWAEGTIYDPNNGKTYSCNLTLKSADKLEVRGYVGVSMFGRTDTWTRIK